MLCFVGGFIDCNNCSSSSLLFDCQRHSAFGSLADNIMPMSWWPSGSWRFFSFPIRVQPSKKPFLSKLPLYLVHIVFQIVLIFYRSRTVYTMIKARVCLDHDMPFANFSKMFPDMGISRWCNLQVDILEINSRREDEMEQIRKRLKKMLKNLSARLIQLTSYSDKSLEVVIKCSCALNNSSVSIIEASNCIPVI